MQGRCDNILFADLSTGGAYLKTPLTYCFIYFNFGTLSKGKMLLFDWSWGVGQRLRIGDLRAVFGVNQM